MDLSSAYDAAVNEALERAQFIEESLKNCLETCSEINNQSFDKDKIYRKPLAPLIDKFRKCCTDTSLIEDLEKIRNDRNFIAHKSKVFTLGELQDQELMRSKIEKINQIKSSFEKVHNRILDYRYKLLREKSRLKSLQNKK